MSRIGRQQITIPAGVTVEFKDRTVFVKGPLGSLSRRIDHRAIEVSIDGNVLEVTRKSEDKAVKARHGLYRVLINNMVSGVVKPFAKSLIINGVGYKANVAGSKLTLNIGYSHPVEINAPEGIKISLPQPLEVKVEGIDKELVGHVAAKIRAARPVEPYHLYGIRYSTEKPVKKEGKTAGK